MSTNKAAELTLRTIRYGDDTEDSDFPSDQESDDSGTSTDLESIISGDHELIHIARVEKAAKERKAAEAKKAAEARKATEAKKAAEARKAAVERKAQASKKRDAPPALPAAEEDASDDEEPVPEDGAAENSEERCVCVFIHIYPRLNSLCTQGRMFC